MISPFEMNALKMAFKTHIAPYKMVTCVDDFIFHFCFLKFSPSRSGGRGWGVAG